MDPNEGVVVNGMTRRDFVKAAGLLGMGGGLSLGRIARAAEEKGWNVLFMMTDEQHARSLSLTGNPYIETPHMDRIGGRERSSPTAPVSRPTVPLRALP